MSLIRRATLPVTRWRNGAGRKADIATGPDWLIGYAFLDADAPFSDYAGFDRTITLVEGPGFTLAGHDGREIAVAAPFLPTPFDGGWPTECRLGGGPCTVLNAMSARARWRHDVAIYTASGPHPPGHSGAVADILVVLRGEMRIEAEIAFPFDAIRIDGGATAHASEDALICRIRILPA